jgi:EcsC protein family
MDAITGLPASPASGDRVGRFALFLNREQPMSVRTKPVERNLTPYEAEQVEQIAGWKSTPPNAFSELFKLITTSVSNLVEKVIPDRLVIGAIEKAYQVSERIAGQEDIKRQGGVAQLGELREKPLEECDRLAQGVAVTALTLATIEGAATGAAGVLTTVIDIPLLFILSLRTILRVGHCYGYSLDHPHDRTFVLGVLITATSGSLATKRKRLDQLREIKHLLVEETQEEILADEALAILFQLEIFEEVPGVGLISGALLNLAFVRRVEITARRVFQERWLEDNGKVHVIKPAAVHARHLAHGWRGAVGRAAYSGCYAVAFGVTFPAYFLASVARSTEKSLVEAVDRAASMAGSSVSSSEGVAAPAAV